MRKYLVSLINWGIDHFDSWVVGLLISAIVLEVGKEPLLKPFMEFYKLSLYTQAVIGVLVDIYWWINFTYSVITGFFKAMRKYFSVWLT